MVVTVGVDLAASRMLLARVISSLGSVRVGVTLRKTAWVCDIAAFREAMLSKSPGNNRAPRAWRARAAGEEGLRARKWTCTPAERR